MNVNEQIIKGKWLEIKGEVQKAWGKITDDELDKANGDLKSITGLVQQKYGEDQKTVKIEYRNAQGSIPTLTQIVNYFVSEPVDLLATSTTVTQSDKIWTWKTMGFTPLVFLIE